MWRDRTSRETNPTFLYRAQLRCTRSFWTPSLYLSTVHSALSRFAGRAGTSGLAEIAFSKFPCAAWFVYLEGCWYTLSKESISVRKTWKLLLGESTWWVSLVVRCLGRWIDCVESTTLSVLQLECYLCLFTFSCLQFRNQYDNDIIWSPQVHISQLTLICCYLVCVEWLTQGRIHQIEYAMEAVKQVK